MSRPSRDIGWSNRRSVEARFPIRHPAPASSSLRAEGEAIQVCAWGWIASPGARNDAVDAAPRPAIPRTTEATVVDSAPTVRCLYDLAGSSPIQHARKPEADLRERVEHRHR